MNSTNIWTAIAGIQINRNGKFFSSEKLDPTPVHANYLGISQHYNQQVHLLDEYHLYFNLHLLTHAIKTSSLNRVDDSRIKDVGPDRAAAEWLLRCGAGVRWKDKEAILTDYNSLPPGGYRSLFIEEIDATGSCIMSVGFPHLSMNQCYKYTPHIITFIFPDGLKHLKKLTLHKCMYLDNDALPMLAAVKDSLEDLQLSSCGDISDAGVKTLACLSNLRHLLIYDLPEVRNKEECKKILQAAIPKCEIEFPYALVSEVKSGKDADSS